jgi:hypothetical protein
LVNDISSPAFSRRKTITLAFAPADAVKGKSNSEISQNGTGETQKKSKRPSFPFFRLPERRCQAFHQKSKKQLFFQSLLNYTS